MRRKNSGFTLVELLAVIIIIGVLMLIAIPSITEYISTSRKKAYVATANRYVDGAMAKVSSLEYSFTDMDTTYYIPIECINLEKGGKSPYGEWKDAYVVVEFAGDKYKYYWTSSDSANMGVYLISINDLSVEHVITNVTKIRKSAIGGASKIGIVDKNSCNVIPLVEEYIPEPAPESCFAFNSSTKTITRYYENEGDDVDRAKCPKEVVIPEMINGVTVEILYNAPNAASGVFYDRNITSVVLPSTLKIIGGYAFYQNKLSGTLKIPKSVTMIGNYAFYGSGNTNLLTSVVFEADSELKTIGNSAFMSNALTGILTIPKSVTMISDSAFASTETGGTNQLTGLTFESGSLLETIGTYSFQYNKLQGTLVVPKTVTSIQWGAFRGTENGFTNQLTGLIFENDSRLETIGMYAFAQNNLQGTLTIPKTVTRIDQAAFYGNHTRTTNQLTGLVFESGSQLQTIGNASFAYNPITGHLTIPKTVTSIVSYAFSYCKLTSLDFESGSQLKLIDDDAFYGNELAVVLTIPASVTEIKKEAFWYTKLIGLEFEPGSQLQTIGNYAFAVTNLTGSLKIPASVKTIGNAAFVQNKFTSVLFENNSQLVSIGSSAFSGGSFSTFTIPAGVTSIDNNALQNCTNLTTVINKTGNPFIWSNILGVGTPSGSSFETGVFTVTSENRTVTIRDTE